MSSVLEPLRPEVPSPTVEDSLVANVEALVAGLKRHYGRRITGELVLPAAVLVVSIPVEHL